MYRLLTFIAISLIVLFSTSVLAFDSKPTDIDVSNMLNMSYSYVSIKTFGSALGVARALDMSVYPPKTYYVKRKTSFILRGVGFVVKEGYIVTAAHVVHPSEVSTIGDKYGYSRRKPIKVLKKHIVVSSETKITGLGEGIPVEIYYLDIESDIAILKYDKDAYDLLRPIPFKMSFTKDREQGIIYDLIQSHDVISTIVRKRDKNGECEWEFEVRNAKITSTRIYDVVPIEAVIEFNRREFLTDLLVYLGDSGSPAIVYEQGEPLIVGVITSTHISGPAKNGQAPVTTVVRIDSIKLILEAR